MGSPSWGIYNGYELIENKQRPGFEEQIDNEKYEVKVRDWSKAKQYGVAEMLTALNKIRRAHPAALSYHNLTVLPTSDPNILAFARHTPAELTGTGKADTMIVIVNTPVDDSPGTQRAGSAHRPPAQRARRADRPRIPVGLGQLRVSGSLGGCGPHPVRAVMRYCNGNATVMPLTCMGLSCA